MVISQVKTFTTLLFLLSVSCAASAQQARIRVMTYNIHHANPPSQSGLIDVEAIADVIKKQNPDLVALQEVDVNTGRSGKIDQAKMIASRLGMKYFFAKAIDHDGGDYGIAILSKFPLAESVVHKLPTDSTTKGEPRVLAMTTVMLPGGKRVRFANTHLDAQRDSLNRDLQIKAISNIVEKETLPVIIAGDLNAHPRTGIIRQLDSLFVRTCDPCAPTIPVINPTRAIDFIAVSKGIKSRVIIHEVIQEQYASDHLPVVAVIELSL